MVTKKRKQRKITTPEMEVALARYFNIRTHIIVPNLSWGFFNHECDLFLIRKSNFGFEIEIKISIADLKKDLKKKHGHVDKANRIVQLYYAIPKELLEKAKEYIPENCGILTIELYNSNGKYTRHVSTYREAKRKKGARRLTEKEQLQITRLGTMRIWSLKEKLINLK